MPTKNRRSQPTRLHLAYKIDAFAMHTSIHRNHPRLTTKFSELEFEESVWCIGTYLSLNGSPDGYDAEPGSHIHLDVHCDDNALKEKKKDFIEYQETRSGSFEPKIRKVKGIDERVFREPKGITLLSRRQNQWYGLFSIPPEQLPPILFMLSNRNESQCSIHIDVLKDGRHFWATNLSVSGDLENW